MNNNTKHKLLGAFALLCVLVGGLAIADFRGDLRIFTAIEADTLSASAPGAVIDGSLRLGSAYAVSLTSPTVTFTVPAGYTQITLNSNANQTGIYPADGVDGQVLVIRSGTGSNTMRFDDGANTALGANITLTESQNDVLTLFWDDTADIWMRLSNADN